MRDGEWMGGAGAYSPAVNFDALPDGQRGVRIDVRPSIIGQLDSDLNGPWAQNVESGDYTLYCVREWRAAAGPWDLRAVKLDVQIGSGAALQTVEISPDIPARGLAWHVQAQTIRAKPRALPGLLVVEAAADDVLLWLARGRPVRNIITQSAIGFGPNAVPAFARIVTFNAADFVPPLPLPLAPDTFVEWSSAGGNIIGRSPINGFVFWYGQEVTIPPLATSFRIIMAGGPPNPYGLTARWECFS